MRHLILFFILTLWTTQSWGAELSPEAYLHKVSVRLTGKWPTPKEYQILYKTMKDLDCAKITCLEDYFRRVIRAKLDTSEFYSEAVLKTFEKFEFQIPRRLPFPIEVNQNYSLDSYDEVLLAYKIFHNNLSLDQLYTSQTAWKVKQASDYSDQMEVYSQAMFAIEDIQKWESKELDRKDYKEIGAPLFERNFEGHPNISGMFSTQKFLKRYWNSPVNGNRKRAAAVFKIMLCDPMLPALERDIQKNREEALALGKTEGQIQASSFEEMLKNKHANQKDCAECHQRLDPAANTMRSMELGISKFPAAGRLRYYSTFKEIEDLPVQNFRELIVKITQQPKYADCQMNWLFNWIVGKDVQIHPMRYMELLNRFEANGRKVKSIIEDLMMSIEFQGINPKFEEPQSLVQVNGVLKNCNFCHAPFLRVHGDQLKINLKKISMKLDLANDGKNPSMPPKNHWWDPHADELKLIKDWIFAGAPLIKGKATLTENEIRKILSTQNSGVLK